jgi:hypothetical protein
MAEADGRGGLNIRSEGRRKLSHLCHAAPLHPVHRISERVAAPLMVGRARAVLRLGREGHRPCGRVTDRWSAGHGVQGRKPLS